MNLLKLVPAPYRMFAMGLIAITIAAFSALSVWQIQNWRFSLRLEHQARLAADTLNEITLASATLQRNEQKRRLALEQHLKASEETHYSELANAQKVSSVCVISLLLLSSGCQSSSARPIPVSVQCQPPPAPAAWFMEPVEPKLSQRMLSELSASPTTEPEA